MPLTHLLPLEFLPAFLKRRRQQTLDGYKKILQNRFSYFRQLGSKDQQRFAERLYHFRHSKKFFFIGIEKDEEITVLVSAAAIQLTFGLVEYRLGFFRKIYIMKGAYTYGFNTTPWAGHVNRKGIHVSWDHVQRGYASDSDGYNVGLHEMAHALEYEFAYGAYAYEDYLKTKFNQIRQVINTSILNQPGTRLPLFSEQGLSNLHECWAESIEFFFENPHELQLHYPVLFDGITQLLSQHPLKRLQADAEKFQAGNN